MLLFEFRILQYFSEKKKKKKKKAYKKCIFNKF